MWWFHLLFCNHLEHKLSYPLLPDIFIYSYVDRKQDVALLSCLNQNKIFYFTTYDQYCPINNNTSLGCQWEGHRLNSWCSYKYSLTLLLLVLFYLYYFTCIIILILSYSLVSW